MSWTKERLLEIIKKEALIDLDCKCELLIHLLVREKNRSEELKDISIAKTVEYEKKVIESNLVVRQIENEKNELEKSNVLMHQQVLQYEEDFKREHGENKEFQRLYNEERTEKLKYKSYYEHLRRRQCLRCRNCECFQTALFYGADVEID